MSKLRNAPLTFWYGLPIVVLIAAYALSCVGGVLLLALDPNVGAGRLLAGPLFFGAAILGVVGLFMFRLLTHKSRGSAWVYTIATTLVYGVLLAVPFAILGHAKDHKMPGWALGLGFAVALSASTAVYIGELRGK